MGEQGSEEIVSPKTPQNKDAFTSPILESQKDHSVQEKEREEIQKFPKEMEKSGHPDPGEIETFTREAERFTKQKQEKAQINEKLRLWTESMKPDLMTRAMHFGLEENDVIKYMDDVLYGFEKDLVYMSFPDSLQEIKEGANSKIQEITDKTKKTRAQSTIESVTPLSLVELTNKRLNGYELTEDEQWLIEVLLEYHKENILGQYDPLLKRLEVSLLGINNRPDFIQTLQHEFTHFALHKNVPEGFEIESTESTSSDKTPSSYCAMFITAIDEASAHRAEIFFGRTKEPSYEAYSDRLNPSIFRIVYKKIDNMAKGKDLAQFDTAITQLYKHFVSKWKPDLNEQDLIKSLEETF